MQLVTSIRFLAARDHECCNIDISTKADQQKRIVSRIPWQRVSTLVRPAYPQASTRQRKRSGESVAPPPRPARSPAAALPDMSIFAAWTLGSESRVVALVIIGQILLHAAYSAAFPWSMACSKMRAASTERFPRVRFVIPIQ